MVGTSRSLAAGALLLAAVGIAGCWDQVGVNAGCKSGCTSIAYEASDTQAAIDARMKQACVAMHLNGKPEIIERRKTEIGVHCPE